MTKKYFDKMLSMQEILRLCIDKEKDLIEFYTQAHNHARTVEEDKMFKALLQGSHQHIIILEKQLSEIKAQQETDKALSYDVY
jgi:rubrerythrin